MKRCSSCLSTLDRALFDVRRASPDGLSYKCKTCSRAACKANYEKNKNAYKARAREWVARNREKRREISRAWQLRNLEQHRARGREYIRNKWKENPEKEREKSRLNMAQYKLDHPERVRATAKRAYQKKWTENRERCLLLARKYTATRRAREASAALLKVDFQEILRRDGYRCHICRLAVEPKSLEFDHVIPLALGGAHSNDNISVAHRSCNRVKGARTKEMLGIEIL
jgi:5-methylcytosine-specific restriction endonuclease McrA